MNRCAECAAESPPEARFCMSCGAPFERRCPACGAPAPEHARFCIACGGTLEAGGDPDVHAGVLGSQTAERASASLDERRTATVLFADQSG
jgi:hypothetical protein